MRLFFFLFIMIPIIEIALLIEVGSYIGAFNTVGLIVLTAFIGIIMLRQQGIDTLLRARRRLDEGEVPAREMVDGIFLAVAGICLLTPGFFTDALGFLCLIPEFRLSIISFFARHTSVRVSGVNNSNRPNAEKSNNKNNVLEGEIDDTNDRDKH